MKPSEACCTIFRTNCWKNALWRTIVQPNKSFFNWFPPFAIIKIRWVTCSWLNQNVQNISPSPFSFQLPNYIVHCGGIVRLTFAHSQWTMQADQRMCGNRHQGVSCSLSHHRCRMWGSYPSCNMLFVFPWPKPSKNYAMLRWVYDSVYIVLASHWFASWIFRLG